LDIYRFIGSAAPVMLAKKADAAGLAFRDPARMFWILGGLGFIAEFILL